MKYLVKFRDKTEEQITEEQADKLKAAMMSSKPPTHGTVGDRYTRISEIVTILPDYDYKEPREESPKDWQAVRELIGGKACRGQHSIQNEINQIAKGEGDGWQQRIQDTEWREATRLSLREANAEGWCDAKADECACK